LLLSHWKMTMGDAVEYASAEFDDTAWLDVTNGAWEMQLVEERDEATYPVTLWYRTRFEAEFVPSNLRLLVDGFSGKGHTVFVNGTGVRDKGRRSSLDAEIKEIDIASMVRPGVNIVAIRLDVVRRTDGILDPLKIVGAFALDPLPSGYRIVAPRETLRTGDWTKQGYPFYSGTGAYRAEVELPARYAGGKLFLEAVCGEDVLEVRLNGQPGKTAPWHPYRLDITDLMREGTNTLELRVTNTLINLLEGVQKASGLAVPVKIVHHHRYTLSE